MEYKYFHITTWKNTIYVIILSTEQTSVYWSELKSNILIPENKNKVIVFDFLYRNGIRNNRFFYSKINNTYDKLEDLKHFTGTTWNYIMLSRKYFKNNIDILQGSVLTKSEIKQFSI